MANGFQEQAVERAAVAKTQRLPKALTLNRLVITLNTYWLWPEASTSALLAHQPILNLLRSGNCKSHHADTLRVRALRDDVLDALHDDAALAGACHGCYYNMLLSGEDCGELFLR